MKKYNNNKHLISACCKNERQAQNLLYTSYCDAMYNTALRILNNREDAKDILQLSFVKVFRNLSRFKYKSTVGVWIRRIVVNESISFLKKKQKFKPLDLSQLELKDAAYSIDYNLDMAARIKESIGYLPTGYRTVLSLYLFEGYDHKEIASILGISKETSKSQYHRAKEKVKKLINEKEQKEQRSL